jgi:hypothetical protein
VTEPSHSTSFSNDNSVSRSAEIYLEAARRFLDLRVGTDEILDTRNITIFSIGSTILPVTFGLLNLADTAIPQRAEVAWIIALAAYVFLLVFSWRASSIRGLEYRPELTALEAVSEQNDEQTVKRWVAREYASSAAVNLKVLNRKMRWVGAANICLYLEAFLVSLAALWTLL